MGIPVVMLFDENLPREASLDLVGPGGCVRVHWRAPNPSRIAQPIQTRTVAILPGVRQDPKKLGDPHKKTGHSGLRGVRPGGSAMSDDLV
jgi:hypothetical protein